MNIRYMYLRDERKNNDKRGFPVAVLAYLVEEEAERVTYGVATFDPTVKGAVYDSLFLREIAVGRLVLHQKSVPCPKGLYQNINDVVYMLMASLTNDESLPKRTKRAVQLWLLEAANRQTPVQTYSSNFLYQPRPEDEPEPSTQEMMD